MRHNGFSLVEVLVALVVSLVVLASAAGLVAGLRRGAGRLWDSAEALDARRIARTVVRSEIRTSRPGVDWTVEADTLPLRAFRGMGFVCGLEAGWVTVRVRGLRAPDVRKDSVLFLGADWKWSRAALLDRRGTSVAACPGGGDGAVERWLLSPSPVAGSVLRYYERGTYALAGNAFRYRRGGGGLQPLTPNRFDDERSSLRPHSQGLVLEVWTPALQDVASAPGGRWSLRSLQTPP